MRPKGIHRITSPEKTSAITSGIEMTRGESPDEGKASAEYLTGGNGVADESGVKRLVMRFMRAGE